MCGDKRGSSLPDRMCRSAAQRGCRPGPAEVAIQRGSQKEKGGDSAGRHNDGPGAEREPEESRTVLTSGAKAWLAGGATN